MKKRFTKNLLIKPRFQLGLIGFFLGVFLLNTLVLLTLGLNFIDGFAEMGTKVGLESNHPYFRLMAKQKDSLVMTILLSSLIGSFLMALGGLIISHRIAGPILRLCSDLTTMKEERKLKEIHFRKGDLFLEVPEKFNELVRNFDDSSENDK